MSSINLNAFTVIRDVSCRGWYISTGSQLGMIEPLFLFSDYTVGEWKVDKIPVSFWDTFTAAETFLVECKNCNNIDNLFETK